MALLHFLITNLGSIANKIMKTTVVAGNTQAYFFGSYRLKLIDS